MGLVQQLLRLQVIDREWDEKAQLYQTVRQKLIDQSELENRRRAQQEKETALSEARSKLRDAELELESLQNKAKQVEQDLYSGRIRSPRELESLRQDSEYLHKRIAEMEDRVLLAMTEVDDLEAAVQEGKEALQAFEENWAKEQANLTEQYKELRARLQELQTAREELRASLGRAELALYDELRKKKGGVALSPVKDGICQLCRVTVPSYKIELVEAGETIVTCEGCGRILYKE
ncbi:MAG: hypothetical protein J7M05_00225 [Anaerolineae bacterium]|nr:hypothetical protein [Anaerolineae bacterium]